MYSNWLQGQESHEEDEVREFIELKPSKQRLEQELIKQYMQKKSLEQCEFLRSKQTLYPKSEEFEQKSYEINRFQK